MQRGALAVRKREDMDVEAKQTRRILRFSEDFPTAAWAWTVPLTRAYGDRGCLDKVAGPRRGPTRAAGGGKPCARSF